jgi:hypothetical protein
MSRIVILHWTKSANTLSQWQLTSASHLVVHSAVNMWSVVSTTKIGSRDLRSRDKKKSCNKMHVSVKGVVWRHTGDNLSFFGTFSLSRNKSLTLESVSCKQTRAFTRICSLFWCFFYTQHETGCKSLRNFQRHVFKLLTYLLLACLLAYLLIYSLDLLNYLLACLLTCLLTYFLIYLLNLLTYLLACLLTYLLIYLLNTLRTGNFSSIFIINLQFNVKLQFFFKSGPEDHFMYVPFIA